MMIFPLDPPESRRIACHDFLHTFAHHTWPTPLSTPMFFHVNSAFELDLHHFFPDIQYLPAYKNLFFQI